MEVKFLISSWMIAGSFNTRVTAMRTIARPDRLSCELLPILSCYSFHTCVGTIVSLRVKTTK